MKIKRVIYTSSLAAVVDDEGIEEILNQARHNNKVAGITGILILGEDQLIQCLESLAPSIDVLIDKISADPRHLAMKVVFEEDNVDRLFGEWSMGCVPVSDAEMAERLGEAGVLNAKDVSRKLATDSSLAMTFISGFVDVLSDSEVSIPQYLGHRQEPVNKVFHY